MNSLKKFRIKSESLSVFFSILPLAVFLLVILFYPLVNVIYHSFTKWTIRETIFIGWDNYEYLISSGATLLNLLKNNLIVFIAIPIQILFSLIIAYLLYTEVWGWRVFRILFYLPSILSVVIIGHLFRLFFSLNGPINNLFKILNLDFLVVEWFRTGATSFIVIIIAIIWSHYGMAVLIFLSGMSAIEPSILESAKMDGAGWWRRFTKIVVPMLTRTIEFYLVILIIGFFTSVFGYIYSITLGGPGYETTTIEYMIYSKAFKSNLLGQSSALAVILFFIVLIITIVTIRIFRKFGGWQE